MRLTLPMLQVAAGLLVAASALGQGTFIYDQQSFTSPLPPNALYPLSAGTGQSFIPDLSSVGFVQLGLQDGFGGNSLGATVAVTLHSGAINGPIIGMSDPVFMPDGFLGTTNFFFSAPVSVAPNTSYFFEPLVQTGDVWYVNTAAGLNYPNGTMYIQGTPHRNAYFWFREGVLAPEPGGASLVLLWAGMVGVLRRKRTRREN